jgi:hypothetical protein
MREGTQYKEEHQRMDETRGGKSEVDAMDGGEKSFGWRGKAGSDR